jgi:hypothetical protein
LLLDISIETLRIRFGTFAKLALEDFPTDLKLAECGCPPPLPAVELHECPMDGFLERILDKEPNRNADCAFGRAGSHVIRRQARHDVDGALA